ncbi:hypothetical protein OUZ56_022168 [Daphnia magna]|uniref:Uncharacterized protein n=1 Tax=Daphnia magna TaxID=35525 RepID=A0ABR0AVL4_9CRUS|nr:hypothetical protein OUZ56_022168 [Daphnia magna]
MIAYPLHVQLCPCKLPAAVEFLELWNVLYNLPPQSQRQSCKAGTLVTSSAIRISISPVTLFSLRKCLIETDRTEWRAFLRLFCKGGKNSQEDFSSRIVLPSSVTPARYGWPDFKVRLQPTTSLNEGQCRN